MSVTLQKGSIISEKDFELKWRDLALESCDYLYACCPDMSKTCEHACESAEISAGCSACLKKCTLRENVGKLLSLANMKRWIA